MMGLELGATQNGGVKKLGIEDGCFGSRCMCPLHQEPRAKGFAAEPSVLCHSFSRVKKSEQTLHLMN